MKHLRLIPTTGAIALALAAMLSQQTTNAALLAYEGFNYNAGLGLQGLNGGYLWTSPWATATANSQVASGSLVYQDSLGNYALSSGNSAHITGDGIYDGLTGGLGNSTANPFRKLATRGASAGTTWISFMALRTGQTTTNAYSNVNGPVNYGRATSVQLTYNATPTSTAAGNEHLSFGRATVNVEPAGLVNDTWGYYLRGNGALTEASTDPWNTPANANSTADFILVKINHNGGISNPINDSMEMWVNPILSNEGLLGAATLAFNPGDFGGAAPNEERDFAFNAFRIFAGNWNGTVGNYGSIKVDEIKVGETYGDVTFLAVPEPSMLALFGIGGLALVQRLRRK
jgi:hypothetical protein